MAVGRTRRLMLKLVGILHRRLGRILTRLETTQNDPMQGGMEYRESVDGQQQVWANDRYPESGGPPAHWVELVRERAPQLLEPATNRCDTTTVKSTGKRAAVKQSHIRPNDMPAAPKGKAKTTAVRTTRLGTQPGRTVSSNPVVGLSSGNPASQPTQVERKVRRLVTVKEMVEPETALARKPSSAVAPSVPHRPRPATRLRISDQQVKSKLNIPPVVTEGKSPSGRSQSASAIPKPLDASSSMPEKPQLSMLEPQLPHRGEQVSQGNPEPQVHQIVPHDQAERLDQTPDVEPLRNIPQPTETDSVLSLAVTEIHMSEDKQQELPLAGLDLDLESKQEAAPSTKHRFINPQQSTSQQELSLEPEWPRLPDEQVATTQDRWPELLEDLWAAQTTLSPKQALLAANERRLSVLHLERLDREQRGEPWSG